MDNLAMDSTRAIAAGMSYGMWKALHPHTKQKPPDVSEKPVKPCHWCGNPLPESWQPNRKFCCDKCKQAADRIRNRDRYRAKMGLTEADCRSKLTAQDVMEARKLRAEGAIYPEIAKRFGVSASYIRKVIIGESCKDVPMGEE